MSAPAFTKGPWFVEIRKDEDGPMVMANHRGPGSLFCVCQPNYWADNAMADAHLIGAAPELYDFIATLENDDGAIPAWLWEKRNALLAKARGEETP